MYAKVKECNLSMKSRLALAELSDEEKCQFETYAHVREATGVDIRVQGHSEMDVDARIARQELYLKDFLQREEIPVMSKEMERELKLRTAISILARLMDRHHEGGTEEQKMVMARKGASWIKGGTLKPW